MKYIKILLPGIFSLAISCAKKQESAPNTAQTVNQDLIDEIENMHNPSAQKASYSLLNPQERLTLWRRHFENYQSADLNDAQKEHLAALQKFLTAEMFSGNRNMAEIEKFTIPWEAKAKTLFEKPLLADIVTGINNRQFVVDFVAALNTRAENAKIANSTINPNDITPPPIDYLDCNCSTKSDYCQSPLTCGSGTNCKPQDGCGFLLSYTCNGKCNNG